MSSRPVLVLTGALLSLILLAGVFFGFDSRGALSDRNLIIGTPVSEGIIAVHDFSVRYNQDEMDSMAVEVEATVPVFLRRDDSVASSASGAVGELIFAATGSQNLADYFSEIAADYYTTGLLDLQELRSAYEGSRAVVIGRPEENISGLFTVAEARESMRLELSRRDIPEEKIPQVVNLIVSDLSIDHSARDSAVAAAVEALPRDMRVFLTGDVILPPGGLYTTEISRYWDAMVSSPVGQQGLIEHKAAKTGLAAVLFLLAFVLIADSRGGMKVDSFSQAALLFTIWAFSLILTILMAGSGVTELSHFSFTMLGAGLTAVFFDQRSKGFPIPFSWMLAGVFSAVFAVHSPHPVTTLFVSFVPSCFVAYLIDDLSDKAIFRALSAGMASSVLVFWLLSQTGSSGSREFSPIVWLVLLGLPLVTTGTIRVLIHPLELLFRMSTPLSYQRLQSDSHPLRIALSTRAPGTYSHSTLVAEMAGKAAEALGADPVVARLGGMFHDIGKLRDPGMFIENMTNPDRNSPHLDMSPLESARVIVSHVDEGLKLADRYHLPRDLRDIIHQHHGDSPVRFFLEKARRELPPGGTLNEDDYHYHCPVPKSTEAALVMLADSISSAVTGLGPGATDDQRTMRVAEILRESEDSGQFDRCCFSPSERRMAVSIFMQVMGAKNYERVKNFPHGK